MVSLRRRSRKLPRPNGKAPSVAGGACVEEAHCRIQCATSSTPRPNRDMIELLTMRNKLIMSIMVSQGMNASK